MNKIFPSQFWSQLAQLESSVDEFSTSDVPWQCNSSRSLGKRRNDPCNKKIEHLPSTQVEVEAISDNSRRVKAPT